MQNTKQTISQQKPLLAALIAVGISFVIFNLIDQENYIILDTWYPSDIEFIIIPLIVIILSLLLSITYKAKGDHGKAWILFLVSAIVWFAGEQFYSYGSEDIGITSTVLSDVFYIAGYPFFFAFSIYYIKSFRDEISPKLIIAASLAAIAIVIPSIMISFYGEEDLGVMDVILIAIYPILDGIILVPALMGVYLFFTGKVNLMWTLLLLGVIVDLVAETIFIGSYLDDSYYPGHVSEVFYVWSYVLSAFGLYYYLKLHKNTLSKIIKNNSKS